MDFIRDLAQENSVWNNDGNASIVPYSYDDEDNWEVS